MPRPPRVEPLAVHSPSRGKLALANHGEVALRAVEHLHPPPQVDPDTYTSWSGFAEWIEGAWYAACVEETRRLHGLEETAAAKTKNREYRRYEMGRRGRALTASDGQPQCDLLTPTRCAVTRP